MTTTHLTRPMPGTEPKGEPIEAKAWRNMYFLRDGRTAIVPVTHSTEGEAKKLADDNLNFARSLAPDTPIHIEAPTIHTTAANISHAIQIPWNRP